MIKKILLGLSAICALYFTLSATFSLYAYSRIKQRAWPVVSDWRIIEVSQSQYAIEADYSFEYKKITYKGSTKFAKPYSFNRPSAEKEIKILQEGPLVVHFDPKNPAYSSLQRKFPLKKCLHAMLTIGVAIYFLFLDRVFLEKRMQKA
jgi:hypothetical protein